MRQSGESSAPVVKRLQHLTGCSFIVAVECFRTRSLQQAGLVVWGAYGVAGLFFEANVNSCLVAFRAENRLAIPFPLVPEIVLKLEKHAAFDRIPVDVPFIV